VSDFNESIQHDFIEDLKRSVSGGIPTSSYIVGEVIKTIYDESSSAADLAEIIERDPPLTAKILKVANSAYYGATKRITSLQRAVVILGFGTIKELVTTIAIVHSFFHQDSTSGIDRAGLWLHSVGTAKASQLIAARTGTPRADIGYTIGLLHDIGKIVLALSFPDLYSNVLDYSIKKDIKIIEAERKVLNIDHCMIGSILCSIWDLPDELSNPILYHHNPGAVDESGCNLCKIVHIGDQMCRKAGIGNPGDHFKPDPDREALSVFGESNQEKVLKYQAIYREFIDTKEDIEAFFKGL
jgi:HD-like signal output (HDOD) protein